MSTMTGRIDDTWIVAVASVIGLFLGSVA